MNVFREFLWLGRGKSSDESSKARIDIKTMDPDVIVLDKSDEDVQIDVELFYASCYWDVFRFI